MLQYFTLWPYLIGIPISFATLMGINGRMAKDLDEFVIGTALALAGAGLWPVVLIGAPPALVMNHHKLLDERRKLEEYRLDKIAKDMGLSGKKFHRFVKPSAYALYPDQCAAPGCHADHYAEIHIQ